MFYRAFIELRLTRQPTDQPQYKLLKIHLKIPTVPIYFSRPTERIMNLDNLEMVFGQAAQKIYVKSSQ